MMDCGNVIGILLAAGIASRFGSNKLEAMLGNDMLGLHAARTLAEIGCNDLFAVHDPANAKLASGLQSNGFTLLDNDIPHAGLSHSLALAALAATAATEADAMLVCLADMPSVTTRHLLALIDAHRQHPDCIIASATATRRSPPALFPRAAWPMLATLTGDVGARQFLYYAIAVQTPAAELIDIDSRDDLTRLVQTLSL